MCPVYLQVLFYDSSYGLCQHAVLEGSVMLASLGERTAIYTRIATLASVIWVSSMRGNRVGASPRVRPGAVARTRPYPVSCFEDFVSYLLSYQNE